MTALFKAYRKKPVLVEAHQFDGTAPCAVELIEEILGNGHTARYHSTGGGQLVIDMPSGGMLTADPGDWVVRLDGYYAPVKPDRFEATYEEVTRP